MYKNYTLVLNFWYSQKITICSVFLFQSLFGYSQTTRETTANQQLKTEAPTFSNQEEKDLWLKENQIKSNSTIITPIISTSALGSKTITTSNSKNEAVVIEQEADFPKYIETGDPMKDSESYATRKQKWIEQYPEEYQQLINSKN